MASSAFSAQRQVIQDSEELQFYLRDLKQWESQIKGKDRELLANWSNQPIAQIETQNDADRIIESKPSTKSSKSQIKSSKSEKISAYDYAAWDKFEADKACEDSSLSEEMEHDDAEMDLQCKQAATIEKDKGNSYLKAGKLDKAIDCYTKGYSLDPHNALLPANRALAYIKQEQYTQAEMDCSESLAIDPTYVKAYQRRAVARIALRKFALAKEDLLQVLNYEPKNKEAHNELLKLEQTVAQEDVEAMFTTEAPEEADGNKRNEKKLVEVIKVEPPVVDNVTKTNSKKQNSTLPEVKLTTLPLPHPVPEVPPAPTSSFQFQKEFRRLKSHPEVLYKYIKQIPASSYQEFFNHSLEYEMMSAMFRIYRDFYMWNNDDLYTPLLNLTKTKRFVAIKLFLSADDKKVLREIFDYMKKTHDSPEQLNALIAAYDL